MSAGAEGQATDAKIEAVRRFLALFHATDLDLPAIREALAPDARWQPLVPIAPTVEGADAICAEAERQYRIYADCRCEILHAARSGSTVFTERVDRVRLLGDDREVVTRVAGVFDLDEAGRIAFWREYWDGLDIAAQIGVSGEEMRAIMDPA